MTPSDRQYFNVGAEKLDFAAYCENFLLGLRRHVMGETLDTLPAARKKRQIFRVLHFVTLIIYYLIIAMVFWLLLKRIGLSSHATTMIWHK